MTRPSGAAGQNGIDMGRGPTKDGRMIQIVAPATRDVLALLRRGEIELDGLMVQQVMGTMATVLRSDFPELPQHAHLSVALSDPSPLPRSVVDPVVEFVQFAEAVSVSAHLGYNCSQVVHEEHGVEPAERARQYVPATARRTIVSNARLLRDLLGRPLRLENRPAVGRGRLNGACGFICEPAFICEVIHALDCDLLLDVAHAQITAAHLEQDVHTYIEALPLERVTELHVSGPREIDGRLSDAHETLRLEDYQLLDWVLERCAVRTVTVEYSTDRAEIAGQLDRVRRACHRETSAAS